MARVRSFGSSSQNVKAHPTTVDCEYKTLVDESGVKLLHLSTFGSDDREAERKSSQSLQLDLANARELVEILEMAFPELSDRQPYGADDSPPTAGRLGQAVIAAPSTAGGMETALIEAAAQVITDQLRANFQGERWRAVLSRAAAAMETIRPD